MIPRRLVERAIRSLPLLLIPMIVAPAAVLLAAPGPEEAYTSNASIWIPRPPGTQSTGFSEETPAERQAQTLSDLLNSNAFREDVAVAAGLVDREAIEAEPLPGTPLRETTRYRVNEAVSEAVTVEPAGASLVTITAEHGSPFVAQALVSGVIDRYQEQVTAETERHSEVALEYFNEQLALAQEELQERRAALQAYAATLASDEAAITDANFNALSARVLSQEGVVDGLQRSIQQTHLDAAAATQGLTARFVVQDAPRIAASPNETSVLRQLMLPVLALAFGIVIALVFLYVSYRADHALRSSEDFEGLEVPLLAYLPRVTSKQHQPWYRRLGRDEPNFARRMAASLSRRSAD